MNGKKYVLRATDLVTVLLCALLLIGVLSFFAPCGPKEDGSWMSCHWAGRAVTGTAALLLALALGKTIFRSREGKAAFSVSLILGSLLAMLLPGRLIGLCMMADMRCRSVFSPAVTAVSLCILVISLIDTVILLRKK